MSESRHTRHPRDRHEDHARMPDRDSSSSVANAGITRVRRSKPAVLHRSTIRRACLLWITLVIWGTLGPLGFGKKPWIMPIEGWSWIPPVVPLSYASYNDIFTNIVVYLPVGICLGLLLRRRGGVWLCELTVATFLAVLLSYTTEFLQQFMPARTFDRVDLFVNTGAALFGCLLAPAAQRFIRRCHEHVYEDGRRHPWLISAWGMTALTFILMSMPWDLHWPSLEIDYRRSLDLLDIRRFGTFLVLGFLITMAMIERLGRKPTAYGEAIKRIFVCGVFFEAFQLFLLSHACGLLDISTAFFGGLAGIGAARWLTGTTLMTGELPTHTKRLLALIVLIVLIVAHIGFGVAGGLSNTTPLAGSPYFRLPFQILYMESFDRVVIHVLENLFLYGTVTMLCLYLSLGQGRLLSFTVLLGMVGMVDLFRGTFAGQGFDPTSLLTATCAWIVILRCWKAFMPRNWRPARAGRHGHAH